MIRNALRPWLGPAWQWWRITRQMNLLCTQAKTLSDHGALFDAVMAAPDFAPLQKRSEFTAFMGRVAALRPARICEIGSYHGGTAFLLSRVIPAHATLVLLDLTFGPAHRSALRSMALPGQRVLTFPGDSHSNAMRDQITAAFGGLPIDVLFIDGDHAYEGVSRDLDLYSPLVRRGGLIAFHDIVPLHASPGTTRADPGGVPRFWTEVVARNPGRTEEFVQDRHQDGCGIGLLGWDE